MLDPAVELQRDHGRCLHRPALDCLRTTCKAPETPNLLPTQSGGPQAMSADGLVEIVNARGCVIMGGVQSWFVLTPESRTPCSSHQPEPRYPVNAALPLINSPPPQPHQQIWTVYKRMAQRPPKQFFEATALKPEAFRALRPLKAWKEQNLPKNL